LCSKVVQKKNATQLALKELGGLVVMALTC
jgi:hypothetical protein